MKSVRHAGFSTLHRANKLLASLATAIACSVSIRLPVPAAEDAPKIGSVTVLNYATGWTHDANGYHPALFMLLENSSERDLSNKLIRFQARFTDLHTAEVTIGRADVRRELKSHQQFGVALEGAQGFELPFELHQWPSIEAKAMCRLDSNADDGTETLTIAKVEPVARTQTEAFESLNQATSYNPSTRHVQPPARPDASRYQHVQHTKSPAVERPLIAAAESFPDRHKAHENTQPHAEKHVSAKSDASSALSLLNSKALPGLGDDFYNFEQRFGLPQSFDAKRSDWTWAKYKHSASGIEIIAGAKDRSGKVDVIVMKLPRTSAVDEGALVNAARQMAGKLKTQPLSAPVRSVRYLPSGRLELVSSRSSSYKVVCMTPPSSDSESSLILVLTRLTQETDVLLPSLVTKTALLKCLHFLESKDSE